MAKLYEVGFETPQDYKQNALEFGSALIENVKSAEDFSEAPQYLELTRIHDKVKDNPKLKENTELLAGFYDQAFNQANGGSEGYERNNPREGANKASFAYDEAKESLSLKIVDLEGTGLNFALNINKATDKCQSLVLTNDESEMSLAQVQELARFFFKGGLVQNPDMINLPDNLKLAGDSGRNIKDVFNEAFKAAQEAQAQEETKEQQEADPSANQQQEGSTTGNAPTSGDGAYSKFDSYLDAAPLNPSMDKMRGSMEARAGIIGLRKRQLSWRRNLDGSMTLVCYMNEADQRTDSELDKKGIQSRKKLFAVKVRKGPPPQAWLYIEPGKEIKASYAKMVLGAFKTQGCKYFVPASTDIMGGAGNKAFWEAAGDMLMCPKLKCSKDDDGFMLGNDHLQVILKAMKDKGDGDITETMQYKMRLVKELKGQLAYGESIKKPNSALRTATYMLEGEVLFGNFKSSCQGALEAYMREQADPSNPSRWNTADLACAAYAMKEVLKAVEDGKDKHGNPIGFDYLGRGDNATALKMLLVKEMAESRPQVDKLIQKSYEAFKREPKYEDDDSTQGSALKRAGEEVMRNAKEDLNAFVSGHLEDSYGDGGKIQMHFPTGDILTEGQLSRDTPQQKPKKEGGKEVGVDYEAIYRNAKPRPVVTPPTPARGGRP